MYNKWQLQEAKKNLGQLMKQAARGDAQMITLHGTPTAVVISATEYARFICRQDKLSSALLRPDLVAEDLDIARSRDL
jgi:prevent-host-death family protein